MTLGEAVALLATLATLATLVLTLASSRSAWRRLGRAAFYGIVVSFLLISLSLILLIFAFLTSDMNYLYVWSHSSNDLPSVYKISAVWAGSSGALLLWIWFMSLLTTVVVMMVSRNRELGERFSLILRASCLSVIGLFLVILLTSGVFEPTVVGGLDEWRLILFPEGLGLQPSLQTWEMVLHPLVVFLGYAACLIIFAAASAGIITGDRSWRRIAIFQGRIAWVALTIGIGIGALWAYYEIGWGGYWAWDPVETSSLIIWLAVTAFLHAMSRSGRASDFSTYAPVLGMLSFSAALFSSFVTRAGGVWTSSVHTYGSSVQEGAGQRLLDALGSDAGALGIFALLLCTVSMAAFLAYRSSRLSPKKEEEAPFQIGDSNAMFMTIVLLSLTTLVLILILVMNVDYTQAASYNEFNEKMSIFFVALSITLVICLVWRRIGSKRALWLGISLVALSILTAVVGGLRGFNGVAALSLPAFAAALLASAYRLIKSLRRIAAANAIRDVAPQVIHLGLTMILVAYVASTFMVVLAANGAQVQLAVGDELVAGEYSIVLKGVTIENVTAPPGQTYNQVRSAVVDVMRAGSVVESDVTVSNYFQVNGTDVAKVKGDVLVHKALAEDVYVSFEWASPSMGLFQMRVLPLMNLLWSGFVLLAVGIVLRLPAGHEPAS